MITIKNNENNKKNIQASKIRYTNYKMTFNNSKYLKINQAITIWELKVGRKKLGRKFQENTNQKYTVILKEKLIIYYKQSEKVFDLVL